MNWQVSMRVKPYFFVSYKRKVEVNKKKLKEKGLDSKKEKRDNFFRIQKKLFQIAQKSIRKSYFLLFYW